MRAILLLLVVGLVGCANLAGESNKHSRTLSKTGKEDLAIVGVSQRYSGVLEIGSSIGFCSAFLVKERISSKFSRYAMTAWHCLPAAGEVFMYGKDANGESYGLKGVGVLSGGGIESDWGLIELSEPVSLEHVSAYRLVAPAYPSEYVGNSQVAIGYRFEPTSFARHLYRDETCVMHEYYGVGSVGAYDCSGRKGMSGGLYGVDVGGEVFVAGVLSSGNNESFSVIEYVDGFYDQVISKMSEGQ